MSAPRSPAWWVPSLYFSQGIPYVVVMSLSVILYKRLGVANGDISYYTSWLYLPWVVKPLWSPLVDITGTKRRWVVLMQFLVAAGLGLVALAVPLPGFFKLTLALFWVMALAFMLFYRFDEAQLAKVSPLFLLDARSAGGLGLGTAQVGVFGTCSILALTAGGLLGGFLAARFGLKKMLPWLISGMYLPKLAYVFLSYAQPGSYPVIGAALAVEQFGYGFGFTAFMLYLLYFAEGAHRTAHYAICTGFMALGMMVPGLWSGRLADYLGYQHFFLWVIGSAVPGFVLALRLKVDPEFGKRT